MKSILITPHVINTINALPLNERIAITSALAGELILGQDPRNDLSPLQEMIYSIIRFYVKQDTVKYNQSQKAASLAGI